MADTSKALAVFATCLIIGGFVIYRYCLDQFDTPDAPNENDPWRFVVPSLLTDRRQYLLGFSVYCGLIMLGYLILSFAGPKLVLEIAKAIPGADVGVIDAVQKETTFPILVAFFIVGLNPKLSLPSGLDFEVFIRRLAHRIAYIPKNMDRLFNHMRFSEFDLAPDRITEAWSLIDLRRPTLDAPDLKSTAPLLDRLVLLYVRAAALAGDVESQDATYMRSEVELEVFKQFRTKVAEVLVGLEAFYARQTELDKLSPADRHKAILSGQRDLIMRLEFLYVIFACALTVKGMDRLTERLRTIGFTTAFPPEPGIPWNPILKVVMPSALVLLLACYLLAHFQNTDLQLKIPINNLPTTGIDLFQLISTVVIVHSMAIAVSMASRTRLIRAERYHSETGSATVMACLLIFGRCYIISTGWFLVIFFPNLVWGLQQDGQFATPFIAYLKLVVAWSIVPGVTGIMTAITIDRAAGTLFDRVISGIMQSAATATAAILVTNWTQASDVAPPLAYTAYSFYGVVYGGLGFVFGYMLPAAVHRYWQAQANRMPDRIAVLRTSVLRYFYDIQQFTEWLYANNPALDGRRPLDVLVEETGVQRLIAFVGETRKPIAAA